MDYGYLLLFEVFLKDPEIIIMRFGENNVLCLKYIDIYEFGGYGGDVHIPPYIFCLLLKKTEKVQKHDLY